MLAKSLRKTVINLTCDAHISKNYKILFSFTDFKLLTVAQKILFPGNLFTPQTEQLPKLLLLLDTLATA